MHMAVMNLRAVTISFDVAGSSVQKVKMQRGLEDLGLSGGTHTQETEVHILFETKRLQSFPEARYFCAQIYPKVANVLWLKFFV